MSDTKSKRRRLQNDGIKSVFFHRTEFIAPVVNTPMQSRHSNIIGRMIRNIDKIK